MTVNSLISQRGKVYLIGAGPGDPELLTIKAVKAIASADVLMVDDLVNPLVLQYALPHANIMYVGKRGGCTSTVQADIEQSMLSFAWSGKIIARIKGGDPYIFGRGGEEFATVLAAGIECEVINGITSGLAAATEINIPLTHRQYTQGVIMVTGHNSIGYHTQAITQTESSLLTVNWKALAATQMTLVIYMGITQASYIQKQLLMGGLSSDTPAAVIQNARGGSRGEQSRHCFMTLGNLSEIIIEKDFKSPSIIVIGSVVNLGLMALNNLNF